MSKVVLTEREMRKIVTECVKRCLNELQAPKQMPQQRINKSNYMQKTVDDGGSQDWADDYLAQQNTYFGRIAKLAKENNVKYTQVIADLQQKILYYMNSGYFGKNQDVLNVVKLFTELLSYLHGRYEVAITMVKRKMGLQESIGDLFNGIRYKKENQYGVQQHVKDDSGNQYAVQNQKNGQWMTDLQNELRQLQKWNFLHGPKTIEATNLLIQFLEVEKRQFFAWFDRNSSDILKKLKRALIGITLITTLGTSIGGGMPPAGGPGTAPGVQPPSVENVTNQQKPVNVNFQINSAEITPEFAQQLQNMPQGNYKIIVHETANSSGKDASYESNLVQQRGQAIQNLLKGSNVTIERGENVVGNMAYCEVMPM